MDDEWYEMEEGPFAYDTIPAVLSGDQQRFIAGQNAFAINAYHRLSEGDKDFCFSPASIWFMLGLAHAGTAGATRDQIGKVLCYPEADEFDAQIGGLMRMSNFEGMGRQLAIKNAIWFANDMILNPSFRETVESNFGATLNQADFAAAPRETLQAINEWVAEQTNQRIRNLLSAFEVNAETRITLVNTAYFKGAWVSDFMEHCTEESDFYALDGARVRLQMMRQNGYFCYLEERTFQAVSLPYSWNETEMLILLPTAATDLSVFEASFSASEFDRIARTLRQDSVVEVELSLPKFTVESDCRLERAMKDMGMRQLFSSDADFSPISSEPFPMSALVHKAIIEVDEQGTEAVAVTAMAVAGAVHRVEWPEPKIFRADHPFIFLIRDTRTGMILFMGRYTGMAAQ